MDRKTSRLAALLAVLAPAVLFALPQAPPPEVDQALRSRATEFLQDHIDGTYRKAEKLVAEDSKDFYFGQAKWQLKSFKIEDIKYSDNFTKAEVKASAERTWFMMGQQVLASMPMAMAWKIEDGQWMYYVEPSNLHQTPMGASPAPVPPKTSLPPGAPKNLSPEEIQNQARGILGTASSVDKSELTLADDKVSTGEVVFHNGAPGSVSLSIEGRSIKGLTAELDKSNVNAGENAVVKFRYEPVGKDPKPPVTLRLVVEPFNQMFPVTVSFAPSR